MKSAAWAVLVMGMVAFGCGSDGSSGDGGNEDEGAIGSSEFSCCINGDGYACPNQDAFDKCAGFDIGACMQACAFGDPACAQACNEQLASSEPDPGDCTPSADACSSDDDGDDTCSPTASPCESDLDCCEGLSCTPRDDGIEGNSCE